MGDTGICFIKIGGNDIFLKTCLVSIFVSMCRLLMHQMQRPFQHFVSIKCQEMLSFFLHNKANICMRIVDVIEKVFKVCPL